MASTRLTTIASKATQVTRHVKPILSTDAVDAHRRVLNLYKAWCRQTPFIIHEFDLYISERTLKNKVKELILNNQHITDIRVIDMLVIRGQMELNDTINKFKQECHIMAYFKDTHNPKPKDFISKFLAGHNSE